MILRWARKKHSMNPDKNPEVAGSSGFADTVQLKLGLPPRMVFGLGAAIVAILIVALLSYSALRQQSIQLNTVIEEQFDTPQP